MNQIIRVIFASAALALACSAGAQINFSAAPKRVPHPTQLVVKYKDELLPVVSVKDSDPIVMVKGQEKRLRTEPLYLPTRARDYGPEWVELSNPSLSGTQIGYVIHPEDTTATTARTGNHGGVAEFGVTLNSRRTLKGGFIAVVLYSSKVFESDSSLYRSQIVVRELPELPANTPVSVRFNSKMFTYVPGQLYFVQVFDGQGRESMTNVVDHGWPYYSQVERQQLQSAVVRYQERFAGQNHAAAPVVTIRPVLPEDVSAPKEALLVRLTVSAKGIVTDVYVSGTANPKVIGAVKDAMYGWLFFPRLLSGQPIEAMVEVPIQF